MNPKRSVARAWVLGLTLALSVYAAGTRAGDQAPTLSPPLTNEDIVRMVASGTPEPEIREEIRTREEAFDLSEEMIEELKLAGVSGRIVAAMVRRRAESAPPAPLPEREAKGRVPLVVNLKAAGSASRSFKVPAWANEDAKAALHLPKETDQREVKDLAVFLACSTAEHVPELWRSKSPLGRDMHFVARHQMLAFVAGDTPAGKDPRLVLPARLEAEVEEGEPHDIVLGVAARIGDRWIQLGAAVLKKTTVTSGQEPLSGRVDHVGRGFSFKVELKASR